MSRVKTYRSADEILDIFGISLSALNSIIKKHKIDSFTSKGKIQIHAKDFYKVYVTHYNPSLFEVGDKKKKTKDIEQKVSNDDIFQKLFGTSYQNKKAKKIASPNLIGLESLRKK